VYELKSNVKIVVHNWTMNFLENRWPTKILGSFT